MRLQRPLIECRHCGAPMAEPEDSAVVACFACGTEAEYLYFPALHRGPSIGATGDAVATGDEATCFFHADKQAAGACDACGRFVCSLCHVEWGSRTVCPRCVAAGQQGKQLLVRSRVLYDNLALAAVAASVPFFVLSFVTAPLAIGLAAYSFRAPGSLVPRRRWRAWLAIVCGTAILGTWIFIVGWTVLRSRV